MVGRLNGKRVLLTAAGQGIGWASALAMAEEGADVVATDINEETLEALSSEGVSIDCRKPDVLDQTVISTLVGELGAVDVLFNCAGTSIMVRSWIVIPMNGHLLLTLMLKHNIT